MPKTKRSHPRRKKAAAATKAAFGYPLNDEQREAVTHGDGPLLIIAGAGTGKTTVITERIAWLIREKKAKAEEILALTFTDKAAGEMEERIDKLLPYGYVDLWVSTFHAFGERVLREYGVDIGLAPDFKLLSTADQWLLLRRNLARFDLGYYKPLGNPTKFLHALLEHFSRAKDENVLAADYVAFAEKETSRAAESNDEEKIEAQRLLEVARAYVVYEQLLRESGHMDFGDLIVQTLRLFRERPNILAVFRKRFRFILVDEFQDTNFAQYELVKLLVGAQNNITAVGDDDQSIYKFRGAAVSNILEFKKDFPKSDEVVLTRNYRSRQNILDLAYAFIQQNNPHRLEVQLNVRDVGPKGKPLEKAVVKKLRSAAAGQGIIAYELAPTDGAEATWVMERLLELKSADPQTTWNDFAILLRANRQAELFTQRLERAGIPFQFLAARGLYQRPEILDLIALLKLLDNYHESSAMFRVLSMPLFALDHRDVALLLRHARQRHSSLSLAAERVNELAEFSEAGRKKVAELLVLLRDHSALAKKKKVGEVLYHFFQVTSYFDRFDRDRDHDIVMNIAKFYRRIREFEEANDDASLKAFMEETKLLVDIGEDPSPVITEEGPEAVKIMTIHGAKGLEFSYVFLPQLVDKRFPSIERRETIPLPDRLIREIVFEGDMHLEEERRLFYVAATRAKKGLFLSSAEDYGGARKKKPSRFLFELGMVKALVRPKKIQQLALELAPTKTLKQRRSKASYELPARFSFTQLVAFRTCPKQYWYAHLLKIPVTGNPNFSFGKSIHATLKELFAGVQRGSVPTEEELRAMYERHWLGDWYESDEHEALRKEKGWEALRAFYQKNKKGFDHPPVALEKEFNLKIGPYTLRGFIDRIDSSAAPEKDVTIIDYKTGSVPKTKKDEYLDQLMLYAIAAKEVLGFEPRHLVYEYIEHDTRLAFDVHEETLAAVKERVLATIGEIEKSDFTATPGRHCQFCDFRDICEDRSVEART